MINCQQCNQYFDMESGGSTLCPKCWQGVFNTTAAAQPEYAHLHSDNKQIANLEYIRKRMDEISAALDRKNAILDEYQSVVATLEAYLWGAQHDRHESVPIQSVQAIIKPIFLRGK